MILTAYIINIICAILMSFLVIGYIYYFENDKVCFSIVKIVKAHKIISTVTFVIFTALAVSGSVMYRKHGLTEYSLLRNLMLIYTLFLISVTDLKKKIIPNRLIIFLMILRIPFLAVEAYMNSENVNIVLRSAFIGFTIALFIMLVMMVISRKSIGAGDVKLYAVLGLYIGAENILSVMLFSFIYSAIIGLALMAFKKVKAKDTIPMAPFVFLATLTYFVFTYFFGA